MAIRQKEREAAMPNGATMEPLSAKLRHDEKASFMQVRDSIGTTPSNAIRTFVSAFNKRGGFPFDPSTHMASMLKPLLR